MTAPASREPAALPCPPVADIYELRLALDLRDELSDGDLSELRWHQGLGPRPDALRIVTSFPYVDVDDDGTPVVVDDPHPLLGAHGEGHVLEGALGSALVRRERTRPGAWALTSRQELHPDDFDLTGRLLTWLARRAAAPHHRADGTVHLGWTRFHESDHPEPLLAHPDTIAWPT